MAQADIQVLFDGTPPGVVPRFAPGAKVRGTLRVLTREAVKCSHLYIRLKWRTEGKGDRDEAVLGTLDVFQTQLRAQEAYTFPFEFTLPREPWSYAGFYINIVWGIDVEIDVPWAGNPREFVPFVLAPDWAGAPAYSG